jgi:hypothetical protein
LDALVDYVLAESITPVKPISTKYIFVDLVAELCAREPAPSLPALVRILRRVLDKSDIFDDWHLTLVKAIHHQFNLCQQLALKPSVDLIESIFKSLQKHSFPHGKTNKETEDKWEEFLSQGMFSSSMSVTNKLNSEEIMFEMRSGFQKLFRYERIDFSEDLSRLVDVRP